MTHVNLLSASDVKETDRFQISGKCIKKSCNAKETDRSLRHPMSWESRLMPKGQKTRERIVAEAASLFNQRGFEGSSMSELIHPIGAVGIWFGLDPNDTP